MLTWSRPGRQTSRSPGWPWARGKPQNNLWSWCIRSCSTSWRLLTMCRCRRCTGRCCQDDWIRPLTRHWQPSSRWHRYTTSSQCCALTKACRALNLGSTRTWLPLSRPKKSCLGHLQGGQRGWRIGLLAWGRSLHQPQSRKLSYCIRGRGPETLVHVPMEHPWGRYHKAKNTWTSAWPIWTCWRCCFDRNTSLKHMNICLTYLNMLTLLLWQKHIT